MGAFMVDCKSFFLSGIENREGQWNINSPVYIWAHLISCLTLICPEPKTKFASFFRGSTRSISLSIIWRIGRNHTLSISLSDHSLSIFLNSITHYHMCFCCGCVQLLLCLHSVLMNPCPKLRGSQLCFRSCSSKYSALHYSGKIFTLG